MNIKQLNKYRYLGLNIAYYRKERGLSQEALAELVNISRTHMSRIETADCAVSLDVVFDICDALNVPPSKIFDFRGAVAKFFFAAALLLHPEHSISRPRLPVTAQIFTLGHSKADRGIFPGLPVDNFLCSTTTKLFSQNNGFPACFFAASSTAS